MTTVGRPGPPARATGPILPPPRRRGPRWARVVGIAVAVAALAGALVGGTLTRPAASRPVASAASTARLHDAIASGKLLFVGASYTVGLGATSPADGYAPVLAHQLDRRFTVAAVSGTGFLNPGKCHQGTYGDRIAKLPATLDPRIVVIQGGRNDLSFAPSQVQSAAVSTIRMTQRRFPHAQVVVLGPIPAAVPVGPLMLAVRNAQRAAAAATGAGFVDAIAEDWITSANERRYAGPVAFHPNDAGYRYIAGRLLADLPLALDRAAPPVDTVAG